MSAVIFFERKVVNGLSACVGRRHLEVYVHRKRCCTGTAFLDKGNNDAVEKGDVKYLTRHKFSTVVVKKHYRQYSNYEEDKCFPART